MQDKKDIIENASNYKAVNAFIFAGSFSIGTMKAGFDLEEVLEISDSQLEENAFFFKKNVRDVPVVLPKTWENDEYLSRLSAKHIDLMCCNCPCSSLSQINRHASADGKNNVHFYRLFNIFSHVKPKVFIIENAPTLIKLGYPILKKMVSELGSLYRFTVVRDFAGNHEVPMSRQRTLVFGWLRDAFKRIPVIKQDKRKLMTVGDTLHDIIDSKTNDFSEPALDKVSKLYKYAIPDNALMTSLSMKCCNDSSFSSRLHKEYADTSCLREVDRIISKMKDGKNFWDKSPHKLVESLRFPSFTSVTRYLHPKQDRLLNLVEMGRIMNYPDWYDFTDEKHECKIPVTQAIAQGVPANFGKYAATQARLALESKLDVIDDEDIIMTFQHHSQHKMSVFTLDEVNSMNELALKKDAKQLKD